MGTMVNLTIIGDENTPAVAEAVFNEISRIDRMMSSYKKQSDISKVNRGAYKYKVDVNRETLMMVKKAKKISDETEGSFDISFASIAHLWNYRKKDFVPPSRKTVLKYLPLVNYKNIKLFEDKPGIRFLEKGMKIGLGGIAKGYTIQRGIEVLKLKGISSGIVDCGGDLQVLGTKSGRKWKTGLRNPRNKKLLLIIDLDDMDSIATSGDYERFTSFKNKKYHHIINPRTGIPTETFASVSVISKDPVLSDAYATSIFVMGLNRTREFLKRHNKIKVVLVDLDNVLYISRSLKDHIDFLEKVNIKWL